MSVVTETLEKKIADAKAKLDLSRDQYALANEACQRDYKSYEKLVSQQIEEMFPKMVRKLSSEDFQYLCDHAFDMKVPHDKIQQWYALFPGINYAGFVYRGKQYESPGYAAPQILLDRGKSVAKVLKDLKHVAKVIDADELHVDILESTCSIDGVYSILYSWKSDKAKLKFLRYGKDSVLQEGSLEDILKYVAEHHPR